MNRKLSNIAEPIHSKDAVNKDYLDETTKIQSDAHRHLIEGVTKNFIDNTKKFTDILQSIEDIEQKLEGLALKIDGHWNSLNSRFNDFEDYKNTRIKY